jgi:hypothetical protein
MEGKQSDAGFVGFTGHEPASHTYSHVKRLYRYYAIMVLYHVMHCTENPIYVLPEMKLHGFVSNSYIHVSVRDLYIPRNGLPIWLQQNRQTDPGNI